MAEKKDTNKFSELVAHKTNPFADELKNNIVVRKKKNIKLAESEVLEPVSGEMLNARVEKSYYQFDNEKFIKVFKDKIPIWAELSSSGIKIFSYILQNIQKDVDTIYLSIPLVMDACGWSQRNMVYRGILDLCNMNIISKSEEAYTWYINPLFLFNGDRRKILDEKLPNNESIPKTQPKSIAAKHLTSLPETEDNNSTNRNLTEIPATEDIKITANTNLEKLTQGYLTEFPATEGTE